MLKILISIFLPYFLTNRKDKLEIYDLVNNIAYVQPSIIGTTFNSKYVSFKIIENDKIYTIFATIVSNKFCIFKIHVVYSNMNEPTLQIVSQSNLLLVTGNIVSCFETTTEKILCFFKKSNNFFIYAYNYNLENEGHISFAGQSSFFIKCIHVKGNIGAFLNFFDGYPKIAFYEYKNGVLISLLIHWNIMIS